ncbi:MAG TPA: hypothetical protein VF939_19540 [Puia sp.]
MKKYRQPDQYYYDEYDRSIINRLKDLEKKTDPPSFEGGILNACHPFHLQGILSAEYRESRVLERMQTDERKDYLLNSTPVPQNIHCNTCGSKMYCFDHLFKEEDTRILFAFECPKNHLPRKVIYPNGSEYFFPKRKCNDCGNELYSLPSKEENDKLILSDKCSVCGKIYSFELDNSPVQEEPITEEDRNKYCTRYIRFWNDLKAIADFVDNEKILENEKRDKEELGIDKIEKTTIPRLEQRLNKMVENAGFIKFQFDKPQIEKYVIVGFSAQDPTDRGDQESIKLLTKAIKKELFPTNWRLMATGISYNLGFLSGQLKAYQEDDDLKKIAKEILSQKGKRKGEGPSDKNVSN